MKDFIIDSTKNKLEWQKLSNGTYRAFVTLGVADMPLIYKDAKGNEYTQIITEDELFNEDSLKTAFGLPITLDHPKAGIFNQNKEGLLIGSTLENFVRDGKTLLVTASITDKRGIELIDSILESNNDSDQFFYSEVSPGYFCFKKFNTDKNVIEQVGRQYDHIALLPVNVGRGGQAVVLRTDSKFFNDSYISTTLQDIVTVETWEDEYSKSETKTNNIIMQTRKVTYKDQDYDLPLSVADFVEDSLKKIPQLQSNLDAANGKVEALKIQVDSNKDKITLDQASQIISESIELWQQVEPIFKADSKDYKPDYSLTPTEIKKLYIAKFHPTINTDSASSDFINGVWSGIAPTLSTKKESQAVDKVKAQLDSLLSNTPTETLDLNTDSDDKYLADLESARKEQQARISANNKR